MPKQVSKQHRSGGHTTNRRIPPSLAPLLSDLELDQTTILALDDLALQREKHGIRASTRDIAHRLQARGWLLPLRTRGMYEFAPAARAGSYSSGDPFAELRATIRRRPDLPVALAYETAAWIRGFSGRLPDRQVLSTKKGAKIPRALSEFRIVHQYPRLSLDHINGLPVWQTETLFVFMAARPQLYHDWPNVAEWLPDTVRNLHFEKLLNELIGMTQSTVVRLAYLIDQGGNNELAKRVAQLVPQPRGPVYLGANRKRGVRNEHYNVVDSLLKSVDRTNATANN
jgi:hypothetical protein